MNEELEKLYKAVSAKFDIGTFKEFQGKMDTPEKMQNFYKAVSSKGYDLGSYEEYERRLLKPKEVETEETGKLEEVSGQGSTVTSQESSEPLEASQGTEYFIPQDSVAVESGYLDPTSDLNPEIEGGEGSGTLYNLLEGVEVEAPEEQHKEEDDTTVGGRLYNSFRSALDSFNEGLFSQPELLNSLAASVLNIPSEVLGSLGYEDLAESFRTDPEDTWRYLQSNNQSIKALAEISDYYARSSESYREQLPEDYGNIENSIRQGNYLRAGEELVSGILGSSPSLLYLGVTGGTGGATTVGSILGQAFIKTLPFSATNFRELQREGVDVPESLLPVYSVMNGMVEILDANIGASSFLRREIAGGRLKAEGVQDLITGYLSKSFKENGIPFALLRGGASEGIVQLSHNVIDKYSGIDPDRGLLDNVANGILIGAGMSGAIPSISRVGNAIANKTNRDRVNTLESEINTLKDDLNNIENDSSREAVQNVIETKTDEINNIIETSETEQSNLTQEELNDIVKENNRDTAIQEEVDSETSKLSEESKEILRQEDDTQTQERVEGLQREGETTEQNLQDETRSTEETETDRTLQSQEEVTETVQQTEPFISGEQVNTITERLNRGQGYIKTRKETVRKELTDLLGGEARTGINPEALVKLVEYATLEIADGTITTAKALHNVLQGFNVSERESNRIFNEANNIVEQYKETQPETRRTQVQEAKGKALTEAQERAPQKRSKKLSKKTIRKVTEKGTTGKVTQTTRQAFREHYRTLAKGFREGVREGKRQTSETVKQREQAMSTTKKGISDFVETWANDKGLKGSKVSGTVLNSLVNRLNNAKTPRQIEKFAEYFERTMDKTKEGVRKTHIRNTQSKLRRQARQKGMSKEVSGIMREVANMSLTGMTPEQLYDFNFFANKVNSILTSTETITPETLNEWRNLSKEIDTERRRLQTERLTEKLEEAGIEKNVIEELAKQHVNSSGEVNIETLNNNLRDLYEATVKTDGEIKIKKVDKLRRVADSLKEEIVPEDYNLTENQRNDLQDILDIDLSKLPDKNLIELVSGLRALQLTGKMVGMAQVLAKARKIKILNDKKAVRDFTKNVRLPRWLSRNIFSDKIKRWVSIIPQRTYSLTKVDKNLDHVMGFMGFSQYSMGTNRSKYQINEILEGVEKLMSRYRKDLSNPIELAKLSMYKLIATEHDPSWTNEQRLENTNNFKEGIKLSIDALEKSAKLDRIGGKEKKKYVDNLRKAYDQIKGLNTPEEVYNKLSKGSQALSDYMNESFISRADDAEYVANMAGTKATTFSKENYFPIVYETTSPTEMRAEKKDISELVGIRPMSSRDASGKVISDALMHNVKLKGNELPRGRAYNFNVISNFINEISDQIYTIETNSDIRYLAEMLYSPEVEDLLKNSNFQTTMRAIANDKVNVDQMSLSLPKDVEGMFNKAFKSATRKGAEMALAGLGQAGKQSFPVVADAIGRGIINPTKILKSTTDAVKIANQSEYNRLRSEIIQNSSIGNRNMQEMYGVETGTRAIRLSPKSRRGDLTSWLKRSERGLAKTAMKTMTKPDELATRASLYAYYAEYLNTKGIELTPDSKLNRQALVYAENKVERIANTTDSSLMPAILRNTQIKNVFAFISFSLNSSIDALANIKRISEAIYDGDINSVKEAAANLTGNLLNVVAFHAVSSLLREGYLEVKGIIADNVMKMIGEDDDSEEAEKLREFLANYDDVLVKEKQDNKLMSSLYLTQDLLFRGASVGAGDEVTKYLSKHLLDGLGILNDEQLKVIESKTRYSPDEFESAFKFIGTTGIFADNVYSFIKNIVGTAQDINKDKFQQKYYAKESASGTEWVVPEEAKGKVIDHSLKTLQIAGNIIELSRFIFPLQETQALQRRSDALARQLKKHAYGIGQKREIDQLSALKSLTMVTYKNEDYILNEEQLKWALNRRKEIYDSEYPKWVKRIKESGLAEEGFEDMGEFEDFARGAINSVVRNDVVNRYIEHLNIYKGEIDELRKRKLETIVRDFIKERQKKDGKK